jgi:hypothetical protein
MPVSRQSTKNRVLAVIELPEADPTYIDSLPNQFDAKRRAVTGGPQGYEVWIGPDSRNFDQYLRVKDRYAVIVSNGWYHAAAVCKTREQAEKIARTVTKMSVQESGSPEVAVVDLIHLSQQEVEAKGTLHNYILGKRNKAGVSGLTYQDIWYGYFGRRDDVHKSRFTAPDNRLASLEWLANSFKENKWPGILIPADDLAVVALDVQGNFGQYQSQYVIGPKPAIEKLVRRIQSDRSQLESLPDPCDS